MVFHSSSFQATHQKVRNRALGPVEGCKTRFKSNPELGIMEECYDRVEGRTGMDTIHTQVNTAVP